MTKVRDVLQGALKIEDLAGAEQDRLFRGARPIRIEDLLEIKA